MENTKGFYKLDNEMLLYAPTCVLSLDYQLYTETHDEYVYPIDGWFWFDSKEEAEAALMPPTPENNNA